MSDGRRLWLRRGASWAGLAVFVGLCWQVLALLPGGDLEGELRWALSRHTPRHERYAQQLLYVTYRRDPVEAADLVTDLAADDSLRKSLEAVLKMPPTLTHLLPPP